MSGLARWNSRRLKAFGDSLGRLEERIMCDYSLHTVASRAAELSDTLVSTGFPSVSTRGFAAVDAPTVAVCLRPGTEIAFEKDAKVGGRIFRKSVGDRLARFRQIDMDKPARHHDALEFSNGKIVFVTDLAPGQRAKVLQLPAIQNPLPGRSEPGVSRSELAAREKAAI